ncbi:TlpA disulfide reductase family protein, partial [Tamlana sp. 2_MG-2023]|uniref:peroxiredoxin family protein n=1 Tax=unclassified Tamlana TaxID=2614803 RepID=UPI0026E2EA33
IRTNYTGALREKLLLYNLLSLKVQDTYGIEECLQTSFDLIKKPELKAIFEKMYGRKIRGAEVFNFKLPNTEGQTVSLSDFRGKVVYLDIWFTGCSGCMALAKEIDHKVYPVFKDNPEVVFVSISADRSKKKWLNSVEGERYGLKQYVNLYTEGLGFNHDFLKYYNIFGGPVTMIIDKKGRVFSAAPPKHGKAEELIALIEEATML